MKKQIRFLSTLCLLLPSRALLCASSVCSTTWNCLFHCHRGARPGRGREASLHHHARLPQARQSQKLVKQLGRNLFRSGYSSTDLAFQRFQSTLFLAKVLFHCCNFIPPQAPDVTPPLFRQFECLSKANLLREEQPFFN